MLAIEAEVAGEFFRRGGDLHLPVVDVQDLRRRLNFPRFAVGHHHAQKDVVVLCRLQFGIKQALFKAPRPAKHLVANNVALIEQLARERGFRVQRQAGGLRIDFAFADVVISVEKRMAVELLFVRQKGREPGWRPLIVIVDAGNKLAFSL